ncbi:peptidase MA family metallohydrolase [Laceyella putida]|uniref:Peptidase MA family metallohydrolase n=1 Tax=Laceyella putida TaxID=110101 RepID=A0ABW2RKM4_9BACL
MRTRMKVLWLGLWSLLAAAIWQAPSVGAAPVPVSGQELEEMKAVLEQKEWALREEKWPEYRETLDPRKKAYLHEQKRWFQDAVRTIEQGSFRLRMKKVKKLDQQTAVIQVQQHYRMGKRPISFEYPLLLKKTRLGWKDADLAFHVLKKQRITVYYTHPSLQQQAELALRTLERAYERLHRRLGWTTKEVVVKLYDRPDVFRQFVKPSLPTWAGGWHEANQSIKFIGGWGEDRLFAAGLVHELTHQMVSELSNDNAAYWLQEGAAMYYEAHLLPRLMVQHHLGQLERRMTLVELERAELEKLSSEEAEQYYLNAYLSFKTVVERWGEQSVQSLLKELAKYPYIDVDSSEKMREINQRTRNAWQRAFGRRIDGVVGESA